MEGADDVGEAALLVEVGEPGPFVGEEPGGFLVAAPVLEVGFGVGDVEVAADDEFAAVFGGAFGREGEVVGEGGHEPFLLVLAGGAGLAGGQVEAADGQAGQVDFGVASGRVELGRAEADACGGRFGAGQDGDAGAAFGAFVLGRGQEPVPAGDVGHRPGHLVFGGADLLEEDDVGGGVGEPGHQAFLRGGPDAVDVGGGDGAHGATLASAAAPGPQAGVRCVGSGRGRALERAGRQ